MSEPSALQRMSKRDVLAGLASGDVAVRQAALEDPTYALVVVESTFGGRETALALHARALDAALEGITAEGTADAYLQSQISDPDERAHAISDAGSVVNAAAQRMLDQTVKPQNQADMMAAFGDLPSVIVQVADRDVVLAALSANTDDTDPSQAMFFLRGWAKLLKERPDWETIRTMDIGGYALQDLLIVSKLFDTDEGNNLYRSLFSPEVDEDDSDASEIENYVEQTRDLDFSLAEFVQEVATPDAWEELGLNPDYARDRLIELVRDPRSLPDFDAATLARTRRIMRERVQRIEAAAESEQARSLADDLDI